MKKLIVTFLSLCFFNSIGQTKSALFLGNSYTSVNNLPSLVNQLANSVQDTLIFDSNTPGGHRLMQHASNVTSISKIYSRDWDYVILQAQSQEPSWSLNQVSTEVFPYAKILCDTIRDNNSCTEPLFYMTWGRENGDAANCAFLPYLCTYEGMDSGLFANYTSMGIQNQAAVSPVGAVWNYLRANTAIDLYSADESHPSFAGSYAAAVTFYVMIFEKDPRLISLDLSLNNTDATAIRNAVYEVVYQNIENWNNDQYFKSEVNQSFCDSIFIGNNWLYSNQTYIDTLFGANQFGCDSMITYYLTNDTFTSGISISNNQLVADTSGLSYTWVDCQTEDTLATTSNPFYQPGASGTYQVIIHGQCDYITDCINYNWTGIQTNTPIALIQFNNNWLTYELSEQERGALSIYNLTGQLVYTSSITEKRGRVCLSQLSGQTIIMRFYSNNQTSYSKVFFIP